MKLLASADVHGDHAIFRWLLAVARERRVDALVLAGDLLGCPDGPGTIEDAQRRDAAAIATILESAALPVYYVMGNDDLVELDPGCERLVSTHGRRVDLADVNLVGYQYSLPFMGGVFEKPEDGIRADLDQLERLVDSGTVLVTHSPAYGVLDLGVLELHAGSRAILDLVRRRNVRIHVHGHVHRQFGRSDRHFNVACGGNRRAMIIDTQTLDAAVVADPESAS